MTEADAHPFGVMCAGTGFVTIATVHCAVSYRVEGSRPLLEQMIANSLFPRAARDEIVSENRPAIAELYCDV